MLRKQGVKVRNEENENKNSETRGKVKTVNNENVQESEK
jgi:hypothetical protein